jgi:hypothetical protein
VIVFIFISYAQRLGDVSIVAERQAIASTGWFCRLSLVWRVPVPDARGSGGSIQLRSGVRLASVRCPRISAVGCAPRQGMSSDSFVSAAERP